MVEKVLELEFNDASEKKFKLRVDEPKEDLTATQVRAAMGTILDLEVFTNRGVALVGIEGARTITTTTTELDLN